MAVAAHVYVLPFVSAGTSTGDAEPDAEPVGPPFADVHVTSYCTIALPPLSVGGVSATRQRAVVRCRDECSRCAGHTTRDGQRERLRGVR